MSTFAWVDPKKIGIQGHSFGGYQTNYIVTHSNIFAAAVSSAGMSDLISDYGGIWGHGTSKQEITEIGQSRMGGTLWQKPHVYIENSPLFNADKVTTPFYKVGIFDETSNW